MNFGRITPNGSTKPTPTVALAPKPAAPPPPPEDRPAEPLLLSFRTVAEMLEITPRTVIRLVAKGELPKPIKLSCKLVRFHRAEILEAIERMRREAPR